MNRTRLANIRVHARLSLAISIAIGALIGLGVLVWWEREDARTTIDVINTGSGLTVVINDNRHHILFAGGTDGAAFANAIDDLSNPISGKFDLILIDPQSSADVEERARDLDSAEIQNLPGDNEPSAITQPMIVLLSEDLSIRIEPGSDDSWHALVITSAGTILIRPETSTVSPDASVVIQINGKTTPDMPDGSVLVLAQTESNRNSDNVIALPIGERLTISPDGNQLEVDR